MSEVKILESGWSVSVSNDPKHRPQLFDRPSTTVRKEWCRRPQEAHVADAVKYRRLSVDEIAIIQGFPKGWVDVEGVSEKDRIAVLGNAVPPPLSQAIAAVLKEKVELKYKNLIEICAGIGGLSYGFGYLQPIAKIELWDTACKVLRTGKPWPASCVFEGYAQKFNFAEYKGNVGLLCGGPPCQPWSQSGHQLGAKDPRDVMGFTPAAIAACEPEMFLFENVPGIFTAKEHHAYVANLLKRMSSPAEGLSYGVGHIILNAADFGVPQTRCRVLILGIRNKSNTFARSILEAIRDSATHHDPSKPDTGRKPWVSLREAFKGIKNTEVWRRWKVTDKFREQLGLSPDDIEPIGEAVADADVGLDTMTESGEVSELHDYDMIPPAVRYVEIPVAPSADCLRISFTWPNKNKDIGLQSDRWEFSDKKDEVYRRALIRTSVIGQGPCKGMAVRGDVLKALSALPSYVGNDVRMAYFDSPRRSLLVESCLPGFVDSTWLSIVRSAALEAMKSLQYNGVFVLQSDEEMSHYGRMVLDEVFGRTHHVTTFAWQKKYGPQNDKSKVTPTDAFDYLIVYSKCPLDDLQKIGLSQRPDDIIDDGDWRGCYTAGHKGARSGNEATKFHVNAPPYRWRIVDSKLPKGRHWFDSTLGVLWFKEVEEAGAFWVELEASDARGATVVKKLEFSIRDQQSFEDHFELPTRIWWLLKNDADIVKGGEMDIDPIAKQGVKGDQYSIIFRATGGDPYTMKSSAPGLNRYWEFASSTLVEAIATASASFGKKGNALPSRKTFHDRDNALVKTAVMNWLPWSEFGKTEDASRHAKALATMGVTGTDQYKTAKPQKLFRHLIRLFAPNSDDKVLSMGDYNAVLASVALKMNRFCINISGGSSFDLAMWDEVGKKRISWVLAGKDTGEVEEDDPLTSEGDEVESMVPGAVMEFKVSDMALVSNPITSAVRFLPSFDESVSDFYAALLGGMKTDSKDPDVYRTLSGDLVYVLRGDEILEPSLLAYVFSVSRPDEKVYVVYERREDIDEKQIPYNTQLMHAPYAFVAQ